MRRLTEGRLSRALASILIGVFAYPILIGWGLALPASAQIMPETELEYIAVVPFNNFTEVEPDTLGARAAAAIHQALLDTQAYDPISIEETTQKMADLGLRPPLDELAFQRLGEALGVSGIVFGEIRSAKTRRITRSVQGEVVLMVAIFDVATRTLRAGTITTAHSSPALGDVSEETLIDEALNQATFLAIKDIQSRRPIAGMVQWANEKDVTISAGQNQGVRETTKFVVIRDGQRVGVITVTKPMRASSDARIVEGHARTGDTVREIIEIPAKGGSLPTPGEKVKKKRKWKTLLYALGVAALIYAFTRNKGGKSRVSNFITAAISNIRDSSVMSTRTINIISIDDELIYTEIPDHSAIRMNWTGDSSDVVAGYEIWRDGELYWFEPAETAADRTITFPTIRSRLEVTITTTETGLPIVDYELPGPYESAGVPPQVIQHDGEGTASMTSILRGDFYNETSLYDDTYTVYIGPPAGSRHTYQVRKVIVRPQVSGGVTSYVITAGAPIRQAVVATFIPSLELDFPANGETVTDATSVDFGFYGADGANDYILQVSRDSLFSPGSTASDNLTNLDAVHADDELMVTTKNLESMLGTSLTPGTLVFWRVGSRYTGDTDMPLPHPLTEVPPDSFRYVFSESRSMIMP